MGPVARGVEELNALLHKVALIRFQPARQQRGITGLETAIVLIAFVVVASVFAFTILSAGVYSSEANKQTIHAGLKETRTMLRANGSAFGYTAKNGSTDTLYKVTFIVSNSLAGEPVDLTPPYTANSTGLDPDVNAGVTVATIISYSDELQRLPNVPWSISFIGDHNGDNLLEEGEKAEVTVWLLDRDNAIATTASNSAPYTDGNTGNGGGSGGLVSTSSLITKSRRFVIEMTPAQGAPLTVQRTLPPGLRQVMNLR
jgi:flagellin FlaB